MAVLHPLKVVIDNYPEGQAEEVEAVNNPEDASAGTRKVPFSRVLYIEQDDFREDPPQSSSASRRAAKCACATATSSPAQSVVKNDNGRGRRSPLHLRSGDPRRQLPPTAAR